MSISHSTGSGRTRRIRWLIIAVVFAATVLNYVDRQTLSVLAPVLHDRLRMNAVQYGRVVAAFMLAYTLANGLWGPLIDRLGVKRGYLLAVLWWSVAEVLHVFARNPLTLGICRFLLGAGEAGNWPAAVKTVAEWFPPRERSLAAGIFNSGAAVGALIAPPFVAWLALHHGWRFAFGGVGSAGLLWVLTWMAVYRAKPSGLPLSGANKPSSTPFGLLKSRFIWQFTLAKVFFDPVWYFYTFWFPEYLKVGRGFDLPAIGATAWIPFLAADFGNLAGGFMGGWIVRFGRTPQQGRKRAIALFMLPMIASNLVVIAPRTTAMFAFASIAAFGYTSALSNMLALPGDAFGAELTASVWGFASMGAGLGGMLFSLLTGWMVYKWSFTPAFVLFGCIPLVAAALIISLPESGFSGEAANRI